MKIRGWKPGFGNGTWIAVRKLRFIQACWLAVGIEVIALVKATEVALAKPQRATALFSNTV